MMTTGTEIRVYHCQDNDNLIRLIYEDGELDEIQVSDELAREWTIISWKDLKTAIPEGIKQMTQYCPNCGHLTEDVYCECEVISGMEGYRSEGGRIIHTVCGKPFRPGQFEKISDAMTAWYQSKQRADSDDDGEPD